MILGIPLNFLLLAVNALELMCEIKRIKTRYLDIFLGSFCSQYILLSDKMFYNISVMQICWIWQKVKSQDDRGFQRFLDSVEYNHQGILRYERVYGQGFVSTGGIGTS